jgi:hypothetical protein
LEIQHGSEAFQERRLRPGEMMREGPTEIVGSKTE